MNAEELTRLFQEIYIRLATQEGKDTTQLPDQQIVLAVCREILQGRVLIDRSVFRRDIKYG